MARPRQEPLSSGLHQKAGGVETGAGLRRKNGSLDKPAAEISLLPGEDGTDTPSLQSPWIAMEECSDTTPWFGEKVAKERRGSVPEAGRKCLPFKW